MTEYLKSLYEASIIKRKTSLNKIYALVFLFIFIQVILLIHLPRLSVYITVGLVVSLLILTYLDTRIEISKQHSQKKKKSLFYEIFYPEMMMSVMNLSFKVQHHKESLWPFQKIYFEKMIHVSSDACDIILYQFKIKKDQKPGIKVLFKIPFQTLPFSYLNHPEDHEVASYLSHHHYVYAHKNQRTKLEQYFDVIERCPHLLDVEMIFNGQDVLFMCKIEDMVFINDYQLKDQTFKKHLKQLKYSLPVYHYLKESLKEFDDAHRK